MDKAFLIKTLARINKISPAQVQTLSQEEVKALETFLQSTMAHFHSASSREQALCKKIDQLLKARRRLNKRPENRSAAKPQDATQASPTLAQVLKKFQDQDYGALSPEELALLRSTVSTYQQETQLNDSSRKLLTLLLEYTEAYRQYKRGEEAESLYTAPCAPILRPAAKNTFEAEKLFTKKPRKEVRSLDSIETDLMVSLYQLDGESVVHGDIPEDTLLVVRNGGVTIHGLVAGNVVATEDILVEGNVTQAWLISSKGNIKAKNALNRSHIIAKHGTVELDQCLAPACVFAQGKLHVHGDVHGGKLLGRAIEVDGVVHHGQLHSVGLIQASRFEGTDGRSTVVCLRDSISSEDYGRPLEKEERSMYRSIGKHSYQATSLTRLMEYASRDNLDSMRTMLYFLLGGLAKAQDVRSLRGIQGQSNLLAELTRNVQQLSKTLSIIIVGGQPLSPEESEILATKCLDSLKIVAEDTELMAASFEFKLKGVINKACRDITNIADRIKKNEVEFSNLPDLVENLNLLNEKWLNLSAELSEEMQEQVAEFGLNPALVKQIESDPEKLEEMLEKTLKNLEKQRSSDGYQRLKSSVMRLMQTRLERSKDNIEHWRKALNAAQEELNNVRRALSQNAAFLLAPRKAGVTRVQANFFEQDVAITANPLGSGDPVSTASSATILDTPLTGTTSFLLSKSLIQRVSSNMLGLDDDNM